MRKIASGALIIIAIFLLFPLPWRDHLTEKEESGINKTESGISLAMLADTSLTALGKPASPWLQSPFDSGAAAFENGSEKEFVEAVTLLDPTYLDAALKVNCTSKSNYISEEMENSETVRDPVCTVADVGQAQKAMMAIQELADNGDVEATLFLTNHWLMEKQRHAKEHSKTAPLNDVNVIKSPPKIETLPDDSVVPGLGKVEKLENSEFENRLIKIEQQLVILAASGRPDVLRELATIYATKEPSIENTEWMLAYTLASKMRHPDFLYTSPPESLLKEFPVRQQARIRQKTEEIIAKCCGR